jgi:predicted RNA-binding Zn-ribbon protein involved in translation (DUF1610 family)
MASGNAKTKLEQARVFLSLQAPRANDGLKDRKLDKTKTWQEMLQALTGMDLTTCPNCGQGKLIRCRLIGSETYSAPAIWDSS